MVCKKMKKYQVSQGIFQCNFNSPNLVKSTSTKDKCLTFMPQQSYISLLLQGPELFSFQLGTSNFPTGRVKVSTFLLEPDEQRSNLSSPISSMTASLSSCLDYELEKLWNFPREKGAFPLLSDVIFKTLWSWETKIKSKFPEVIQRGYSEARK